MVDTDLVASRTKSFSTRSTSLQPFAPTSGLSTTPSSAALTASSSTGATLLLRPRATPTFPRLPPPPLPLTLATTSPQAKSPSTSACPPPSRTRPGSLWRTALPNPSSSSAPFLLRHIGARRLGSRTTSTMSTSLTERSGTSPTRAVGSFAASRSPSTRVEGSANLGRRSSVRRQRHRSNVDHLQNARWQLRRRHSTTSPATASMDLLAGRLRPVRRRRRGSSRAEESFANETSRRRLGSTRSARSCLRETSWQELRYARGLRRPFGTKPSRSRESTRRGKVFSLTSFLPATSHPSDNPSSSRSFRRTRAPDRLSSASPSFAYPTFRAPSSSRTGGASSLSRTTFEGRRRTRSESSVSAFGSTRRSCCRVPSTSPCST